MTPRKINPPHYFLLALGVMVCINMFVEGRPLLGVWSSLGAVPIVVGLTIVIVAARQFSRAGTNIVPLTASTVLVADGMFAYLDYKRRVRRWI